uniref:Heparanase n=1 Tax=Leptobrachium leishanense TaxID=445787 RepID=A0A8C5M216_9ANUR
MTFLLSHWAGNHIPVMRPATCLLIWAGALLNVGTVSTRDVVELKLDLKNGSKYSLNQRFLSVTIDASLVSNPKYIEFLWSQKLITLARGLSPAYLRFGGTKSDFLLFDPESNVLSKESLYWNKTTDQDSCDGDLPFELQQTLMSQWPLQERRILEEANNNKYTNSTITRSTIDLLYRFANCSNLHLIYGLNALLRKENGEWNSSNAKLLIDYCASKNYSMSWELGNEPNSFRRKSGIYIDGSQLGKDFVKLHNLLMNYSMYRDVGVFGPDIGRSHKTSKMLKRFLKTGGEAIDSVTFHQYYVDGKNASKSDFLSADILDSLVSTIQTMLKIVNEAVPGKHVFLGETSSAYGGGSPGLSDTYIDGFMWLDKLGISAKYGIDVVMRQALFGKGSYNLVDSNFEPLPDYWLSLLFKKLVGPIVLNATFVAPENYYVRTLRVYMHCTNVDNPNYTVGDVTLYAINLHNRSKHMNLPSIFSANVVDEYLLLPEWDEGLLSKSVLLNGNRLKMVDDKTLPQLQGKTLKPGSLLVLPPVSFGFFVVRNAKASACL